MGGDPHGPAPSALAQTDRCGHRGRPNVRRAQAGALSMVFSCACLCLPVAAVPGPGLCPLREETQHTAPLWADVAHMNPYPTWAPSPAPHNRVFQGTLSINPAGDLSGVSCLYLRGQREIPIDKKRVLPPTGSFPKCLQWSGLEPGIQARCPTWKYLHQVCIGRRLSQEPEWGTEPPHSDGRCGRPPRLLSHLTKHLLLTR